MLCEISRLKTKCFFLMQYLAKNASIVNIKFVEINFKGRTDVWISFNKWFIRLSRGPLTIITILDLTAPLENFLNKTNYFTSELLWAFKLFSLRF